MRLEVGRLGIAAEGELQDRHAREAEALAQRLDLGRDDAQVLGDDRQLAERACRASKSAAPGPFTHWPLTAVVVAAGNLPVGLEAAEVIEPDQVDAAQERARKRSIHQA